MTHIPYSQMLITILILFIAGTLGFSQLEGVAGTDAFHMTVSAVTLSGNAGLSDDGKFLQSALALAAVGVIVWGFVHFHHAILQWQIPEAAKLFKFIPEGEDLVMKEITVAPGSHLVGMRKIDVLKQTGTIIFGIKKKDSYALTIPFSKKLSADMTFLALGNISQLKDVAREAKK